MTSGRFPLFAHQSQPFNSQLLFSALEPAHAGAATLAGKDNPAFFSAAVFSLLFDVAIGSRGRNLAGADNRGNAFEARQRAGDGVVATVSGVTGK